MKLNINNIFKISNKNVNNLILVLIGILLVYIGIRVYNYLFSDSKEGFEDKKLTDLLDKIKTSDFLKEAIWDNYLYNQQPNRNETSVSFWNPLTEINGENYNLLGSTVNNNYKESSDKTLLVRGGIKFAKDMKKICSLPDNSISKIIFDSNNDSNISNIVKNLTESIVNKTDIENIITIVKDLKINLENKLNNTINNINNVKLEDKIIFDFKVYNSNNYFTNEVYTKKMKIGEEYTYSSNNPITSFSVPYGSLITLTYNDGSSKQIRFDYKNILNDEGEILDNNDITYDILYKDSGINKDFFNPFGSYGLGFMKNSNNTNNRIINNYTNNYKAVFAYNYMVGTTNEGLSGRGKSDLFTYLYDIKNNNFNSCNNNCWENVGSNNTDYLSIVNIRGEGESNTTIENFDEQGNSTEDNNESTFENKYMILGYEPISNKPFDENENDNTRKRAKNNRDNIYVKPYDNDWYTVDRQTRRYKKYYNNTTLSNNEIHIKMPNIKKESLDLNITEFNLNTFIEDIYKILNTVRTNKQYNFTSLKPSNYNDDYINNLTSNNELLNSLNHFYVNMATRLPMYHNEHKSETDIKQYTHNCCRILKGLPTKRKPLIGKKKETKLYINLDNTHPNNFVNAITVKNIINKNDIYLFNQKNKLLDELNNFKNKLIGNEGDITLILDTFTKLLNEFNKNQFKHFPMEIYRAIPPEKYRSVGDIIYKRGDANYGKTKFKDFILNDTPVCLPEQCVKEVRNWLSVDKIYEYNDRNNYFAVFKNPYLQTFRVVTTRNTLPEGKVEKVVACVEGCKIVDQIIESNKCAESFYKNNRDVIDNSNLDINKDLYDERENMYKNEIIEKQQNIDNLREMVQKISKEDTTANIINKENNRAKLQQLVDTQNKNMNLLTRKVKTEANNFDINLNFSYNKFQQLMYELVQNAKIEVPVYNKITQVVKAKAVEEIKKLSEKSTEDKLKLGIDKETAKTLISKCPTIDTKHLVLRSLVESGCNCFFTDEELENL